MTALWVDGQQYLVDLDQVIPWVCGVQGTLDTADMGYVRPITIDVDPAESRKPGVTYTIEFNGARRELSEEWVLPWMRGMAVRHNIQSICDPTLAERAQCVQALMVGHQRGLFRYLGLERREHHEPNDCPVQDHP